MKNLIVLCFAVFVGQAAFGQQSIGASTILKKTVTAVPTTQTAQFQVWGNCGMCKKTIESAAKSVTGVEKAEWNVETHQFTVVLDPAKTSADKVHQAVAAAGYDTDLVKGNEEAYNSLHGCCQYERRN